MFKAVFIDIDGTLIKSDHSLSEITISTLQQLKERNILVVLVSARPLHGITPIAQELGLLEAPISSLNGSYIANDSTIIFESFIDAETVSRLHTALQPYGATIIYYDKLQWFAEVENEYIVKEQKITEVPVIIQPFEITLAKWQAEQSGPNKILIIAEPEVVDKIQKDLQPDFDLNMYTSKPIYLEMMNENASKAKAIQFLMDKYQIHQPEIIAIGDNFNDKAMIEFAGLGIAMGNAPDEVKEAADYVTDTNNNDGVAKALVKFIGL
jgi:Cof subfamily protein (haloacid dehalogenase superfamily)